MCSSIVVTMHLCATWNSHGYGNLWSLPLLISALLAGATVGCARPTALPSPNVFIWSWERPDDLTFIDPDQVGVAFLASTIRLEPDGVRIEPRFQPLRVPRQTALIAVVRIEGHDRVPGEGSEGWDRMLQCLVDAASLRAVRGLQVDFDATTSQRAAYRAALCALRARLPRQFPLTITALASWCLDDPWIRDLPVDEAVPMLFRMGRGTVVVRRALAAGRDFGPAMCRTSVGVSMDEPIPALARRRRRFVFSAAPWTQWTLDQAREAVQ